MSEESWTRATESLPAGLVDTTLQLHWAVQFLAAAGQTFVTPRDDNRHRSMRWDAGLRAFVGEPFATGYPFRVALRPEGLTLMLVDRTDGELGTLPLAGKMREEGFEWISLGIATYTGGPPPRIERPEYEMPDHAVSRSTPFSSDRETELRSLGALFGATNEILEEIAGGQDNASEARCCPHLFDIATLISIESDTDAPPPKTVRAGFAPMGGGHDRWHLFVSPRPYPDQSLLPDLSRAGSWAPQGWPGAVLTAEEVVALVAGSREEVVREFMRESIETATAALSGT